jgi:hypothetical protein
MCFDHNNCFPHLLNTIECFRKIQIQLENLKVSQINSNFVVNREISDFQSVIKNDLFGVFFGALVLEMNCLWGIGRDLKAAFVGMS